jgi:hypothetical protein
MSDQDQDSATGPETDEEFELEEFDPDNPLVLQPRSDEERAKVKRVILFELDGVKYHVPNEPRPYVSMNYLYMARTSGVGRAESWLAEELLGPEAYQALLNFKDLTQDQSDAIFQRARAIVFGRRVPKAEEKPSGARSSTARPRKQSGKRKSTRG